MKRGMKILGITILCIIIAIISTIVIFNLCFTKVSARYTNYEQDGYYTYFYIDIKNETFTNYFINSDDCILMVNEEPLKATNIMEKNTNEYKKQINLSSRNNHTITIKFYCIKELIDKPIQLFIKGKQIEFNNFSQINKD